MKKGKILYQFPGSFEENRFEKLHNVTFDSSLSGSVAVAEEIAGLIRDKQAIGLPCVLVVRYLEPGERHDKSALNEVLRTHGVTT